MQDDLFYASASPRPAINVTPGADRRRIFRTVAAVVILTIALPLAWMLGAMIAFVLLGAAVVLLGWAFVRSKLRRRRVVRPCGDIIDMR